MLIRRIMAEIQPRTPRPNPIRDALQTLPGADGLRVVVETDAGVCGESHTFFGRVAGGARALQVMVEEILAPVAVGRDAFQVREVRELLRRETAYIGTGGLAVWGISALDVAL
ncbi:MAG: hypothetical protein KY468_14360, partial [Armatimonadetes bacterium]|nr:hypothetical protein [Armatimonadota bacterium]